MNKIIKSIMSNKLVSINGWKVVNEDDEVIYLKNRFTNETVCISKFTGEVQRESIQLN